MDLGDLRIFVEPQQGATYAAQLAVARRAEQLGFGAFFRSDHYLVMGDWDGLPGPTDSWVTLAALARETETIRLGTLVTSATFRHPGVLAVSVAEVDEMSGGRVELGIGAGWYEAEHRALGVPFLSVGERFDVLEDNLAIITGMWSAPVGERVSITGRRISVVDSPGLPKPVQSPLPIIIGGGGPRRTPRLAARYAAEFNLSFRSLEQFGEQRARVISACEAIGRDPASIIFSAALVVAVGRDTSEFERRAAAIKRAPDQLRHVGVAGTVEQAAEALRTWSAAGAQRVYLQVLDLDDLDHLDLIAREVVPLVS